VGGRKIFYSSDKDDTLNLYSYDPATKKTEQLTHSKKWICAASTDHKSQIVYEENGELNVLNIETSKTTHISISVPTDAIAMRPSHISAANAIEGFGLSRRASGRYLLHAEMFYGSIEKAPRGI